jgi:electron transfer flavoprotein-quinone oxidoreductase
MSNQRHAADVVIVGAGISGWMLAAQLADADLSIAVLEQHYQRPRDGSFAGVVTQSDLDALGLGLPSVDRLQPLETVVGFTLEDAIVSPMEEVSGVFTVRHDDLLAWLREVAVGKGAVFKPAATVTAFQWSDGAIAGVVTGPDRTPWDARVVVLADESDPRLAEEPGLRPDWLPAQLMHIAKQRFDRCAEGRAGSGETRLRSAAVFSGLTTWKQAGFGTLVPYADTLTLTVAMLLEDEMTSARHIQEFMDEVRMHPAIAPIIQPSEPATFVTEVIPIGGAAVSHRLSGDGVLTLGDVAGLTHPLNRDGLSANVDVARVAAETILDAARDGDFTSIALSRFDERVREEVVGPIRRRAETASLDAATAWLVSSRFQPFTALGSTERRTTLAGQGVSQTGQRPVSLRKRLKGFGQRIRHPR